MKRKTKERKIKSCGGVLVNIPDPEEPVVLCDGREFYFIEPDCAEVSESEGESCVPVTMEKPFVEEPTES